MRFPWQEKPLTQSQIAKDAIYMFIEGKDPSSKEVIEAIKNLKILQEVEDSTRPEPLNVNTVLTVSAYIVVAGGVLLFEAFGHAITTKVVSVALPKPNLHV